MVQVTTFDAVFKYGFADKTLEFVENNPSQIGSPEYKHYLVSPDGIEYELDSTEIVAPSSPDDIIGATPEYRLSFEIADLSKYISTLDDIALNETVDDSTEINISPDQMVVVTNTVGTNVASSEPSYSTVSSSNLSNTYGFKGKPSTTYFNSAPTTGSFLESMEMSYQRMRHIQLQQHVTRCSNKFHYTI